MPRVSICVPIYGMTNAQDFLERNLKSIYIQDFDDYEIVISDDSDDDYFKIWLSKFDMPIKYIKNRGPKGMANNSNNAINNAEGELIKILYQDDYFYDNHSLDKIVKSFTGGYKWLVTGCTHTMDGINTFNDHKPYFSESENTIGSPSVLTFRKEVIERFDPYFHWVLDLDLYKRLHLFYGKPKIFDQVNVVIGIHQGQKTFLLSDERKALEHQLLKKKFETYKYD